jgi:peptidoglycan biosynthesis protein MviN/MurJ (putative lipid II flippase)
MIVSFMAVALNLLFNWVFTFRLHWGHLGLAFSTGLVATCNFLVLYVLMYRQLGGLETRRMLVLVGKTSLAGGALAAVCLASVHWPLAAWATQAFLPKACALVVTVVLAGLVFVGCGLALRIEELKELEQLVMRRVRRR